MVLAAPSLYYDFRIDGVKDCLRRESTDQQHQPPIDSSDLNASVHTDQPDLETRLPTSEAATHDVEPAGMPSAINEDGMQTESVATLCNDTNPNSVPSKLNKDCSISDSFEFGNFLNPFHFLSFLYANATLSSLVNV